MAFIIARRGPSPQRRNAMALVWQCPRLDHAPGSQSTNSRQWLWWMRSKRAAVGRTKTNPNVAREEGRAVVKQGDWGEMKWDQQQKEKTKQLSWAWGQCSVRSMMIIATLSLEAVQKGSFLTCSTHATRRHVFLFHKKTCFDFKTRQRWIKHISFVQCAWEDWFETTPG